MIERTCLMHARTNLKSHSRSEREKHCLIVNMHWRYLKEPSRNIQESLCHAIILAPSTLLQCPLPFLPPFPPSQTEQEWLAISWDAILHSTLHCLCPVFWEICDCPPHLSPLFLTTVGWWYDIPFCAAGGKTLKIIYSAHMLVFVVFHHALNNGVWWGFSFFFFSFLFVFCFLIFSAT